MTTESNQNTISHNNINTAISQTMHDEIKHLGLRTTCIDFGFFRTRVLAAGKRAPKVVRIADYQEIAEGVEAQMQSMYAHHRIRFDTKH